MDQNYENNIRRRNLSKKGHIFMALFDKMASYSSKRIVKISSRLFVPFNEKSAFTPHAICVWFLLLKKITRRLILIVEMCFCASTRSRKIKWQMDFLKESLSCCKMYA
uniref:Uncharacterized protein n=1 Tax=Photinus pyralis TaxID=7054 RepID=A0A1Y1LF96_PHOPY